MSQVWFRNNKAAEDWSEKDAENIIMKLYEYVKADETVVLKGEIAVYAMETFGVSQRTINHWVSSLYKNNISIAKTWLLLDTIIENRVVKDQTQMRPNAQNLVLKNKHKYKDQTDLKHSGSVSFFEDMKARSEEVD